MKKLFAFTNQKPRLKLVIEEDKSVGFYLIAYPENSRRSIADYLYDSLEDAFSVAEEKYKVSRESWKEI